MLRIHFLNVGKGNCVVAKFPSGRLSVIDIDNSKVTTTNPLQDPIDFLDTNYPGESVFRFVLSHPDMDHLSGLSELNQKRSIINFWDTNNSKTADQTKMHLGGYKSEDWECYQHLRRQSENPKTLHIYYDNERLSYWKEDGIQVLGPSEKMVALANQTGDFNHCSYVLMIEHRGIRTLLSGDATKEAWRDVLKNNGSDALAANVFLAPHHGSEANIEKDVFSYIEPEFVVVSDHYGHTYAYDYYRSLARNSVYTTKSSGNIHLEVSEARQEITRDRSP